MIGLDIDRNYVRVAELKEASGGLTLTKFALARIAPAPAENISQATSRTISELFAQQAIDEKEVYVSISGPRVQVRRLSLPPMPADELDEAIRWEAKNFVPFPIENAALDYYLPKEIESKGGKQELILVAAEGEALKRQVETVKRAGLKCAGVIPVSFALWEFAKLHPEIPAGELIALVYIGSEVTYLNLMKNQELLFAREIAFTLEIEEETDEKTLYSIYGKLQNEIISSFEYYREQFFEEKIAAIYLLGEAAILKNLKEYLAANFGILVETVDPLKNIALGPKIDEEKISSVAHQLVIPISLALSKGKAVNLMKIKARKKEKGADLLKVLDLFQLPNTAIVGTLVVLVALIFGLNFYLSLSIGKIKNDINAKSVKLSQLVKYRDRKLAFEEIKKQEVDVKLLLARVNSIMPAGITLAFLEFDNKKKEISVGGETADPQIASAFLKKIEDSAYFTGAQLIEITKIGDITTFKLAFGVR
jgi:type IV pilus assembly protein PilM